MELRPCDGPICPSCGCRDAEIAREPAENNGQRISKRPRWWSSGRAICQNCFVSYSFEWPEMPLEPPAVAEIEVQIPVIDAVRDPPEPPQTTGRAICCPDCQSPDVKVYSTTKLVRYYRCKRCEKRFKMPRRPIRQITTS